MISSVVGRNDRRTIRRDFGCLPLRIISAPFDHARGAAAMRSSSRSSSARVNVHSNGSAISR